MSICFISIRHHEFSQTCHSWTKTKWNVSVHFDIEKYDWTDNVTTFQVNTPEWKKKVYVKIPMNLILCSKYQRGRNSSQSGMKINIPVYEILIWNLQFSVRFS